METETKAVELNEENFKREVLQSDKPVLVDFWAGWCGPCKAIAPTVTELAADFEGIAKVGKVDLDAHPSLAQRYAVLSIPALLFFKDGEVVDRVTGVVPKELLAKKLKGFTPTHV
jgi:thioredoxin 1